MNIQEAKEKFKGLGLERLLLPALIIVVGIASFGLGRLSAPQTGQSGLSIFYPQNYEEMLPVSTVASANTSGVGAGNDGPVVASKSGAKYHYPWCSGAKSIAEANKITFATIEEARKAGYTPASNCKGLQ